jgi:hypothetical protein
MQPRKIVLFFVPLAFAVLGMRLLVSRPVRSVEAREGGMISFAAVAGEKDGQDVTGPYEVVPDWPKPLSQLPGHERWTWGAVESVFAESPNRVFILRRGEIPNLTRPNEIAYPEVGPGLSFPVSQLPFRNASVGPVTAAGNPVWSGKLGIDARWEDCIVVVDATGNIIERWTQWDSMLKRPHFITISPYDPEKHVFPIQSRTTAMPACLRAIGIAELTRRRVPLRYVDCDGYMLRPWSERGS